MRDGNMRVEDGGWSNCRSVRSTCSSSMPNRVWHHCHLHDLQSAPPMDPQGHMYPSVRLGAGRETRRLEPLASPSRTCQSQLDFKMWNAPLETLSRLVVPTHKSNQASLYLHTIRTENSRLIGWIGCFKRHRSTLFAQTLQRCLLIVDQGDNNVSGIC